VHRNRADRQRPYRKTRSGQPRQSGDRRVRQVPDRHDGQPEDASDVGSRHLDDLRRGHHQSYQHREEASGERNRQPPQPGLQTGPHPSRGPSQRRGKQPAGPCQAQTRSGTRDQRAPDGGLPGIRGDGCWGGHQRQDSTQDTVGTGDRPSHPSGVGGLVDPRPARHPGRTAGDQCAEQQRGQQRQDAERGALDGQRHVVRDQPAHRSHSSHSRHGTVCSTGRGEHDERNGGGQVTGHRGQAGGADQRTPAGASAFTCRATGRVMGRQRRQQEAHEPTLAADWCPGDDHLADAPSM